MAGECTGEGGLACQGSVLGGGGSSMPGECTRGRGFQPKKGPHFSKGEGQAI